MMSKSKKQMHEPTELINHRFYENQKRQALTTPEENDSTLFAELVSIDDSRIDCDAELNPLTSKHEEDSLFAQNASTLSTTGTTGTLSGTFPSTSAPDKSRKGSVDQRIVSLVNQINAQKDAFFTTSSCSGRIILFTWDTGEEMLTDATPAKTKAMKKGCKWLLVTHDEVLPPQLVNAYSTHSDGKTGDMYFKMEPCILHVQCRLLTDARKLIHIATESGFRNSGMVIGKENRITVAIRSAMGLEVPLPNMNSKSASPRQSIQDEYLEYLAETANDKMRENWERIEKLTTLFSTTWGKK